MNSITAVIPSFNSIKWIKQCVESILAQEYDNLKILAADNESTDGTYEYLKTLKDSRLEVVSLPNIYPNGYMEALIYSFENSDTDFITFVSSDDYVSSEYIENISFLLDKNPSIKCLQSPMQSVNVEGSGHSFMIHSYQNIEDFKRKFLIGSPVNNPTVVYHKSLWPLMTNREAHDFNKLQDVGAGDYDMWGKFTDNNVFIYPCQDFLGYFYRWHPEQASWKIRKYGINYDAIIQNYWRTKWKM